MRERLFVALQIKRTLVAMTIQQCENGIIATALFFGGVIRWFQIQFLQR